MTAVGAGLLVVVAIAAAAPSSAACPIRPQGARPCKKQLIEARAANEPIELNVVRYTRAVAGGIPTDLDRIPAFLDGANWSPTAGPAARIPHVVFVQPPTVDFLRPERLGATVPATTTRLRRVLVRRIERHDTAIVVEIDRDAWRLQRCSRGSRFACLVPEPTYSLTAPEPEPLPAQPTPTR